MSNQEPNPFPLVEVSVVVIADETGRILLDFNESWNSFILPVSKRHLLPSADHHKTDEMEAPLDAAVRAAAEVIGRPIDPMALTVMDVDIPPWNQSLRDNKWKRYTYRVFKMTVTEPPKPVPGHVAVWATQEEIRTYGPISPTVRLILNLV